MAIKEITSRHTHRSIKSRPFFFWGSLFPNDSRLYQVDDKNSPGRGSKETKVNTMPSSLDPDPGVRCLLQVTTAWELLMSYTFDADQTWLKYLDPSLLSPLLTSPYLGESSLLWGWSCWVEQSQFTQFLFPPKHFPCARAHSQAFRTSEVGSETLGRNSPFPTLGSHAHLLRQAGPQGGMRENKGMDNN